MVTLSNFELYPHNFCMKFGLVIPEKNNRWLLFYNFFFCYTIHPGRLTWNLQITHLERKMIFQTPMIMFHVNLPGCIFTANPGETLVDFLARLFRSEGPRVAGVENIETTPSLKLSNKRPRPPPKKMDA